MITPTKSPYLILADGVAPFVCHYINRGNIENMAGQATFVETYTVEQFKAEVGASKIELIPSKNYVPGKTGKYFISDSAGNSVATVSTKITEADQLTEPVISLMIGDDGKEFYLMHNRGTGGIAPERTW